MNITEEMLAPAVDAVCARYAAMVGAPPPAIKVHAIRADVRAAAEVLAPLIAAQALAGLRDAAMRDGDVPLAAWIQMHIRCPTCSGPTRETVGMVCQTCGTDYAKGAP